ncbi:MAG: hypothetical protein EBR69_00310 [Synechococcaceae bacterium WB4_2_0805]|nr:hypothetical protein [Synechococcaceae bacterium WB4_2_0805]
MVKMHKINFFLVAICFYCFSGPIAFAQPNQQTWQQVRDGFLEEKPSLEQRCLEGKAENNKGLSKFNNAYVEKITKLRFQAGVGTQKPSQSFFSGLSAAMAKVCPEVW